MKDFVRFSLVLFLICVIAASFLALIFKITEPRIIEQRQLEEKRAIEEALGQIPPAIERFEKEDLVFYKAKDSKGKPFAYVFIAKARGYSSDIRTVVALNPKGEVISVKILEHQESPGIGTRIEESEFLSQFKNKDINEKFDTITGATISSRTVINSIKKKAQEILRHEQ